MEDTDQYPLSELPISLSTIYLISQSVPTLSLTADVKHQINQGAEFLLDCLKQGQRIYGVNTGFGSMEGESISSTDLEHLQLNLLMSHAAALGPVASEETCRVTMLLKLMTLRSGLTGIPLYVVERLVEMWNGNVIPAFPVIGTVGASGDLAPLAHFALPLLGKGVVYDRSVLRPAVEVLAERGWQPIRLGPKVGLAIANGIQYVTAHGILSVIRMQRLLQLAEMIAAISVQAYACSQAFYSRAFSKTTAHRERDVSINNLQKLLAGSNHFELPTCRSSKQDPYSFRCLPQVHGAVRQAVEFAERLVEQECNTVSDNPLMLAEEREVLYGGNMHGASIALALDCAAIAITDLSSMSQCRTFQLLQGNQGLPDYLAARPGLQSGYMMPQVTAAALYAENVGNCTPASPFTVMTCQLQEDHVSMAGGATRKLERILDNTLSMLAIELLLACQAVEYQSGLRLSPLTQRIFDKIRAAVPALTADRPPGPDIETLRGVLEQQGAAWIQACSLD